VSQQTSSLRKGFVDIQVNGFLGIDFSEPGLTLDQVRRVTFELRDRGTLAYCPTVITSPWTTYEQNLPVLAQAHEEPDLKPHLLGIHLEGPFISPKDGARGAHPKEATRPPDRSLTARLIELAENQVSIMTLAPELEGAIELIRFLVDQKITVAIGHHLATRDQIRTACDEGATCATHLGNGIPNMIPRHPNPIWDQLDEERLLLSLITDGHHLPDSFIRVVTRYAADDRLVIVSDSSPLAGLPPGSYQTFGQDVVLEESGLLWNPRGEYLVGSSYSLLQCMNYLAGLDVLGEEELWTVGFDRPLALLGVTLNPDDYQELPPISWEDGRFSIANN